MPPTIIRRWWSARPTIWDTPDYPDEDIEFLTRMPDGYDSMGVRIDPVIWQHTNRSNDFHIPLSLPFHFERVGSTE